MTEDLNKSIDSLIDQLFTESETVEKADMIKDDKPQSETADEAKAKIPTAQDDDKRGAGRPKQISDVPKVDTDGKRAKDYDDDITESKKDSDGKTSEQDQVKPSSEMVKKSLSVEEFEEYQELKKAQLKIIEAEALKKARDEQVDLIKSAVSQAVSKITEENAELRKSLSEQSELIKAMANKPQRAKAVTNMAALEKSSSAPKGNSLSKSDLLDVAEELVKSSRGTFTVEHAIELENNGFIYDAEARSLLEREIKRRYKN